MRLRLFIPLLAAIPLAAQEPNFGRAMASTGTELLVGQPVNWYGPGTLYSYRSSGDGRWTESSRIVASDPERMDDFGRALAVDGNTLIVAAPRKRDGAGLVYIFGRSTPSSPWQQSQVIEAPNGGEFGASLVLDGNDLLIGAPGADSVGMVHHYHRSGDAWQPAATIRPPSGTTNGTGFGASLARSANHLVIGSPGLDQGVGGVFVSTRSADGTWSAVQSVNIPRVLAGARARIGAAVFVEDNRAFIGAPGAAAVFIAELQEDTWSLAGELRPFDQARGSQFGAAITASGDELWVGAPGSRGGNGGVYRFLRNSDGEWRGVLRVDADSADGTHWPFAFGYAIAALPGGGAAVSTPSRDFGEGRVLVMAQGGNGWTERQQLMGEIHQIGGAPAEPGRCRDGSHGVFTCNNIEVVSHLPTSALGGARGAWVNDVWGWSDPLT
ncbi:MAG TPA: hypothetical protein PLL69_00120, partial [Gemmatimonadales bacterium]|nr:hypothetical protein [Gemmatimonadales bacterium]